jgi:hypothetical protein
MLCELCGLCERKKSPSKKTLNLEPGTLNLLLKNITIHEIIQP